MKTFTIIEEVSLFSKESKKRDHTIGFVPTMGYLHEGHLSLVRAAKRESSIVIVSIYVNPSQFGPQEDYAKYPRDLNRDLELLEKEGVDAVFFPSNENMYPVGYKTWVEVEGWSSLYCGKTRPGHFRGVATVVLKLINIIKPDFMYMGEKDFQQVRILETMLADLHVSTTIRRCPIVREEDGLAKSSRNIYLSQEERSKALVLSNIIKESQQMYFDGSTSVESVIANAKEKVAEVGASLDYIEIIDATSLEPVKSLDDNSRILLAVYIGKTRLIDNAQIKR